MRTKLFLMGLTLMGLVAMTSCGSDNDDPTPTPAPTPTPTPTSDDGIDDAEFDAIINQYVDAVVLPTYNDLKEKNTALYNAVLAFGDNPSNDGFKAICDAWTRL